jgi:hypothetical protein
MVTCIEDLPIEIWLLIFSYFEAHDLFRAFTNLNNYFHQLLTSNHLWYNIQFKKKNYSNIYCSSNTILNRIISLQWIAKPQYGYLPQFLHKNISNFIRLQSLKIEIYPRQISLICKILPELHSLKNLSIKSDKIQAVLIETVFILPSLHLCELISSSAMSNIECILNGQSNIKILYLTNISIVIQSITNSFFDYLPNLRKCDICGSVKTFKSLSFWISNEILMFERIPKLKLKCNSNRITFVFFEQFQFIMSIIKYFSLHIYVDIQDEILLERLINDWWIFIEQIEKINISIRISERINQEKLTIYQNMLLSKINQLKKDSQIQWIQTECPIYQFIAEINTEE